MSALVFTLRNAPTQRVDVGMLNPTALAGQSVADIAAIRLSVGRTTPSVGELFDIAGRIEIAGNVGDAAGGAVPGDMRGVAGGLLLVAGNAGERLGDRMRRGQILVSGNAGDFCGTRMIAGTIAVAGSVIAWLVDWRNPQALGWALMAAVLAAAFVQRRLAAD